MAELRALVVTGGTEVDIDDIRVISNRSKGGFGVSIANGLQVKGIQVTLLAAERTFYRYGSTINTNIKRVPFRTFDELYDAVKELVESGRYDFIFMPAAISDYRPVKVEGKISSKDEATTITLERTPKILARLREWAPNRPFIVGWKLLSGVSREELFRVALKQVKSSRINMTIANDWQEILAAPRAHQPCYVVTPEGGMIPLEGIVGAVANQIEDIAIRRQAVQWSRTELYDEDLLFPGSDPKDTFSAELAQAQKLLDFAQSAGLLDNEDGNVTHRIGSLPIHFWATPRGVQKGEVAPEDFIFASAHIGERLTRALGPVKPSIDCSVHARIYHALPGTQALLHFHRGYVVPHARTTFPYPCGTVEEAEECLRSLTGYTSSPSWTLGLVDHGTLIGFGEGDIDFMIEEWADTRAEWEQHIRDVGQEEILAEAVTVPVIAWGRIAGLVATYEDWNSAYLRPGFRGQGIGRHIAAQFIERRLTVAAHDECKVLDYYLAHGYEVVRRTEDRLSILRLP